MRKTGGDKMEDNKKMQDYLFDFVYGEALRDAINQQSFKGEKNYLYECETGKNEVRTYINAISSIAVILFEMEPSKSKTKNLSLMLCLLMKESTQLKFLSFGKSWNYFKGESLIFMSSIQKIRSFD